MIPKIFIIVIFSFITFPHAQAKTIESHTLEVMRLNINTAGVKQLQKIPGIGPIRAKAIVKYRKTLPSQKFTSLDQLCKIRGVNIKLLQRIKNYIVIA